jgi:hypothetical protein
MARMEKWSLVSPVVFLSVLIIILLTLALILVLYRQGDICDRLPRKGKEGRGP